MVLTRTDNWQVRFHGRGGQGVVTAAELLSVAAFMEGRYSQAFPTFGSERAGAPVTAFCRVSDRPIRTRSPITTPDVVVVQDPTLAHLPEVFAGLKPGGLAIVNSPRPGESLGLGRFGVDRVVTVPATELALAHLGRPVPNAVLLGGLAALSDMVGLEAILSAINQRFEPGLASANGSAAAEAFRLVARSDEEALLALPD